MNNYFGNIEPSSTNNTNDSNSSYTATSNFNTINLDPPSKTKTLEEEQIVRIVRREMLRQNAEPLKESQTINKAIVQQKQKISKIIEDLSTKEKKITELTKKMDGIENKNLETIAIFTAFFTFISLNFQIFSKIENLNQAIVLMVLMLISLLLFVGVVILYTRGQQQTKRVFGIILPSIIFILLCFLLVTSIPEIKKVLKKDFLPSCDSELVKKIDQTCIRYTGN